jgi:thioesterase domain-containing protein
MIMRELAQKLGDNQPSFTIQFTQKDVERIGPNATMQQVAALYIEYLRKIRPSGPYRLGGWCVSGWVAYEMSQQLKAVGEDVELLLILDAWAPNFWCDLRGAAKIFGRSSYYAHRIYYEFLQLLPKHRADSTFVSALQVLCQTAQDRITNVVQSAAGRKPQIPILPDGPFEQMMDSAANSYRPEPYIDSRAMVFRSEEQPRGGTLPGDMGWHKLLPSTIKMISLPGSHTGMFSGLGAIMISNCILERLAGRHSGRSQEEISPRNTSSNLSDVPSCLS